MRGLYPVEVVREAENALMTRVPDGSLMHRAARAIAVECMRQVRERRGRLVGAHVVLLVGSGNNGGDTLFAGAHLAHRGLSVRAICVGSSCHDAGARAFTAAGGRFVSGDLDPSTLEEECANADLIVDGIVGIGAQGALRDAAAHAVERANSSGAVRVAVDLPSGVDADTGDVDGVAFDADVTATTGCLKPGLFLVPGRRHVGDVLLVDIGLEPELPEPGARLIDPVDVAGLVTRPQEDDHKYQRGVVAVAAGSRAYPGAAILTVGGSRYSVWEWCGSWTGRTVLQKRLCRFTPMSSVTGRTFDLMQGSGMGLRTRVHRVRRLDGADGLVLRRSGRARCGGFAVVGYR